MDDDSNVQSWHDVAPAEEVVLLEQIEHESELVPPVLERYRPAGQTVQLAEVCEIEDW
jgi:hypothetical protein